MALSNFCGSSNSFRYKDKILCIVMQVLFFLLPQLFYICGMSTKVPIQINCISCGKIKQTYRHGTKYCSNKCKSRYRRKLERETPPIPKQDLEQVIYLSLTRGNAHLVWEHTTIADIKSREPNKANARHWLEQSANFQEQFKRHIDICTCPQCLAIFQTLGYRRFKVNCELSK